MTRPQEPEFIIQWREWVRAGPPKCCHTCEHYSVDGLCVEFFMTPFDDAVAARRKAEEQHGFHQNHGI